nr:hypothetical protein [Bacteroidota bacterium]
LITDQGIDIRLIKVEGLYLDDYRDKNDPFDFDNFPKLPQQSIGAIKNYLNIRKIEVKNSQIVYEELAENAENAGKVHISKVYGSLYNITNDRKAISKSGRMKWDLQGMLFNQGELKLEVDFPADLTSGNFTFQGRIGPMEMTAFNEMTEPNAYIRIDQGALDSMIFTTQAGEDYSEGELLMVYQDLKLKILKKEAEAKNDVQGFISSLANAVIRSFNPHKKKHGSPADTASIFFVRDKNKSIFNYMVKSLLSGIKGSVVPALSQTKEKYEKKKLKEEQSDTRKERRQERKDKREEKKKGF